MLLLQLAAAADTLIVRQVPSVRTGFEAFVFIVSGVTSVLALLLIAATIFLLASMRQRFAETSAKVDELLTELRPFTHNANAMVEEVTAVARDIQSIADESRDTVRVANRRVRKSVRLITGRVNDLSELIGRVTDSATRIEQVATTTVAGIKFGARALGLSRKRRKSTKPTKPTSAATMATKAAERPRLRRRD